MNTEARADQESGRGWVIFAATYLALAGAANGIWGITALAKKEYFTEGGLVFSNLETWGWISLVVIRGSHWRELATEAPALPHGEGQEAPATP